MSGIKGSGDGTRPITDGGVDNIGAGEGFTDKRMATGEEEISPGPNERMEEKKANADGTKHDDSAAFNLNEDLTPASSKDENKR